MNSRQPKINPEECRDARLNTLNNYRDLLTSWQKNADDQTFSQTLKDALKVVDCTRFVKINDAFLRAAYQADKHDTHYYSLTADGKEYVVRDFNDTALDFYIYQDASQYPDQKIALEICIKAHADIVEEFESAILTVEKIGKLKEFTHHLHYDEKTGCFPKRISGAIEYAQQLRKNVLIFDDLMHDFLYAKTEIKSTEENDTVILRRAMAYFSPYFWKKCLCSDSNGKMIENQITPDFVVDYLVTYFAYDDPRNQQAQESKVDNEEKEIKADNHPTINTTYHYIVKKSTEALQCIREEKAVAKNIHSPLKPAPNKDSWKYTVNTLLDPEKTRPVKKVRYKKRNLYWDPTDQTWRVRQVAPTRGAPKPPGWKYSKKDAVTLMPQNGKIFLYPVVNPVFLLFNLDNCYLKLSPHTGKPKYVWITNVNSNQKFWVADAFTTRTTGLGQWWNNFRAKFHTKNAVTLDQLREHLRLYEKLEHPPTHNEILACLAKDALIGIGTQNDTLFHRLNALRIREMLKTTLGIMLPLFISPITQGPRVYTRSHQIADIQSACHYANNTLEHEVLLKIHPDPEKYLQQCKLEDKSIPILMERLTNHAEKRALSLIRQYQHFYMTEDMQDTRSKALRLALENHLYDAANCLVSWGINWHDVKNAQQNKTLFWLTLLSQEQQLIETALTQKQSEDTLAQAILLAVKDNHTDLLPRLLSIAPDSLDIHRWHYNGKTVLAMSNDEITQTLKQKFPSASQQVIEINADIKLQQAVLSKLVNALKNIDQPSAEEKLALQKVIDHCENYIADVPPEGGGPILDSQSISVLRQLLITLLDTEAQNTYSKHFYTMIYAVLIALCHWWPKDKPFNADGIKDDNIVLTAYGLQLSKKEIRKLFSKNHHPTYPGTTVSIYQRDRDYIANVAKPVYLPRGLARERTNNEDTAILLGYPALLMMIASGTFMLIELPYHSISSQDAVVSTLLSSALIIPSAVIFMKMTSHFFLQKNLLSSTEENPYISPLLDRPEIEPAPQSELSNHDRSPLLDNHEISLSLLHENKYKTIQSFATNQMSFFTRAPNEMDDEKPEQSRLSSYHSPAL
jgi:hypothetical protein